MSRFNRREQVLESVQRVLLPRIQRLPQVIQSIRDVLNRAWQGGGAGGAAQVFVGEPSVEDTISILRGLKEKYEGHHGVKIKDSALVAAATLSNRYITSRYLPDKAIDLVDEAASRIRIQIDSLPEEIDELDRRLKQLEVERQALKKEKDAASRERLDKLGREAAEARERNDALRAHWGRDKELIESMKKLKAESDALKAEESTAERRGDLERVAELRYGRLPSIQAELARLSGKLAEVQKKARMLKDKRVAHLDMGAPGVG